MCNATSTRVYKGSRYSAQRAGPCTSLKEGRATCTSWRPLPRHHAESSGPGPQVPQAGGAVRDLRPRRRQLVSESVPRTCRSECDHRPEWLPCRRCRPAGARPPAGVVYGPSRVRPCRGPEHSESEEERPTGPSSGRRRARAQWERGGEAGWAGFGPAAGPGTVESWRSGRLARARPGRGPGHSRDEEEQPAGRRAGVQQ